MENKSHYIFTFQDSVLECVAIEDQRAPRPWTFDDAQEARGAWLELVAQLAGGKEDL